PLRRRGGERDRVAGAGGNVADLEVDRLTVAGGEGAGIRDVQRDEVAVDVPQRESDAVDLIPARKREGKTNGSDVPVAAARGGRVAQRLRRAGAAGATDSGHHREPRGCDPGEHQ